MPVRRSIPNAEGPPTRSLRSEWSRAFVVMLVLLLLAAAAAIVGVRGLVDEVRGTAHQLHRESVAAATLSAAVVAHEEIGHKLLSNEPVDRTAYMQQQTQLSQLFTGAIAIFPASNGTKATVIQAQQQWQTGLTTYGLWGDDVESLQGDHSAENPLYGAASDGVGSLLAGLESPSLDAMDRGLVHAADLERLLIDALIFLFGLALAATAYYRRRMVRDLLQPVTTMHQGVLKLRAGEYGHRLEVARRDELGELTEAFNGMAGALHDSHLELTFRATHDPLTGLLNRASLTERLQASFAPGTDRRAQQESVLFVDIDDFKEVNDSLGHHGGDLLLVQLAARLSACVREHDTLARLGGDEFAIVVVEDAEESTASVLADRILTALREPFAIGGVQLSVSASIGVAQRGPDTSDAAELLKSADFAMYMAKGSGKDCYQLFDAQEHDDLVSRASVRTESASAERVGDTMSPLAQTS